MMNTSAVAVTIGMLGMALAACAGDSPTDPVGATELTQLVIEPSTPISDADPAGMVILTVLGGETSGTITIEVCGDDAGLPLPGDYAIDLEACSLAGGRWLIGVDDQERSWDRRSIAESVILRFGREPGQGALLFRASYEAPRNGQSKSVPACPWTLVEGSDLGVRCTSDSEIRLLPGVRERDGAVTAF
ncbi:MAG: hypothetical protein OEM23_05055 [Gemmatimonadota bacterium]|nr:hypothetical protein [Gemmatimonadota bacterium]MDH3427784.1 hypothetical protein [Gemmatimonadota bacterium]